VYHEDAIDHHGDFLGPPADFVPWVNDLHAAGYVDRLERRDRQWRIAARETLVDWACTVEGGVWPGIAPFPMGAWDRGDPSYQRPLDVPVQGARLVGE
jgi:hypothetical protein